MDIDLAESVQSLKSIFEKRLIPANFGKTDTSTVAGLKERLSLTDRYAAFIAAASPLDVETVTPSERVRFIPPDELDLEQKICREGDVDNPPVTGWLSPWVVIAHSALLGDPYFLDTSRADAEGDCPVFTAMSGAGLNPVMCASSFATFIHILATAMQVAEGFADRDLDPDDEHIFREALRPKIRVVDPSALRGGHWT